MCISKTLAFLRSSDEFSCQLLTIICASLQCFVDLELRRCAPYVNITVLEQNSTNRDETMFILSLLRQKPDSRGSLCMSASSFS